jgi:hypothetical protein
VRGGGGTAAPTPKPPAIGFLKRVASPRGLVFRCEKVEDLDL